MAKPLYLNSSNDIAEMDGSEGIDPSFFPVVIVSAAYQGVATLDFGSGNNETSIVVTGLANIVSDAFITLWISSDDTTADHTANDHTYVGNFLAVTAGTIVPSTGFTIYARSIYKLTGQFKVRYSYNNDTAPV